MLCVEDLYAQCVWGTCMHDVCWRTCMHDVCGAFVCTMCVGTCMHDVCMICMHDVCGGLVCMMCVEGLYAWCLWGELYA